VNFSVPQWTVIIILDIVFRAAYSIFITFSPFMVPAALKNSFIHLAILVSIGCWLKVFELRFLKAVTITLLATNILFCGWFILDWLSSIKAGRQSFCAGVENYECFYVDGVLTSSGVRWLAFQILPQLVINLLPFVIVLPFTPHREAKQRNVDPGSSNRNS
jgi:hypothetical protein